MQKYHAGNPAALAVVVALDGAKPGSAVIRVAHRSALLAYHDKVLDLRPSGPPP